MALSPEKRDNIVSILNNLLASPTPAPSAVSTTVASLTNAYKSEEDAESFLWDLWTVLFETIVPASNPRGIDLLVHLVVKLQETNVQPVTVWGETLNIWSDLPLFGPVLVETCESIPNESSPNPQEARTCITTQLFVARLYKEKVFEHDHMAIWFVRDGLEEETIRGAGRDTSVSGASTWLRTCGNEIWEKCLEADKGTEDQRSITWAGKLYKGPVWYCKERWVFWRRKLEQLCASGSLGDEARKNAKDAVRVMKQVDGSK